ASKHQDNRNREAPRRTVLVDSTTSNDLVSQCDGLGYDWSDQAKDGPTNFALMAHTSSSSSSAYKAGLEYVEARLEVCKKNEIVFTDDIKILKLDVMLRDKAIIELRQKFEIAEKERDDLKLTLEKFQDSSKNLSRLLDSQQSEGYHAVPPPYTGNFMPLKPDLVFADEHVFSESVTSLPGIAKSKVKTSETTLKNVSAPIIEDWVSDSEDEDEIETESNQIKPSFAKDQGIYDSGCSRHMTGNKSFLTDYQEFDGGFVAFGGSSKRELKFNLFSVSQMCDKKNSVLFIETDCLVLSPDFKLLVENQVMLKVPRQNNMCSFDLKNVVHLGGKADEGFLVGYSVNSMAFKVFNSRTRKVEENLHIKFLENKHNIAGRGPEWLFNIDSLTISMNYEPVTARNQTNHDACIEIHDNAGQAGQQRSIYSGINDQERTDNRNQDVNTAGLSIDNANTNINIGSLNINTIGSNDPSVPSLEETGIFDDVYDDREVGAKANTNNLELSTVVSPIPTTRVHKNHPKEQIIRDLNLETQTRRMINFSKENAMVEKALYGLHQVLRAWYETLSTYLLENGFRRGTIDKTLFIKTDRDDAQEILNEFYRGTHFFLGLQVKQKDDGIFISQDKYMADILKKFDFSSVKTASTLIETHKALLKDEEAQDVDVYLYRSMIRSLMYLTTSRPDIMDSPFDLEAFSDSDYVGASLDRKSTTGEACCCINIEERVDAAALDIDSANVKTINEDVQIRALVDGKKIVVNEASIRRDLRLDDAKGTACLPNAAIFEELARMGYEKPSQKLTFYKVFFSPQWKFLFHIILQCLSAKTTVWNEFSSTMASTIICLANNQKFNLSKYILDYMVKNLEARVKFYMFPRFVQMFVNHQLGDMSHHKGIFVNPSLTKKVLANMKIVGTCFSWAITPLFQTMMVQALEEVGGIPTDTQDTPILTQPSSSQLWRKHKLRKKLRKETEVSQDETSTEEHIPTPSHDPLPSGEDRLQLNKLMEICTKLSDKVLSLEQIKTNQTTKIKKLKKRVKKLEGKKKKKTHGLKRLYKVGLSARVEFSKEEEGWMNDEDLFGVNDLDGDEMFVDVTTGENVEQDATGAEKEVSTADPITTAGEVVTTIEDMKVTTAAATTSQISNGELTLAQTLMKIKAAKPKAKGEDLEVLRSIVKERFKKTKPVDDMDNLLFQTLKTVFEHQVEDNIWKYQQGAVKVHNWKLFESCGVYCVTTQRMVYYLFIEKMYPFTKNILHQLWNDVRLQVDYKTKILIKKLKDSQAMFLSERGNVADNGVLVNRSAEFKSYWDICSEDACLEAEPTSGQPSLRHLSIVSDTDTWTLLNLRVNQFEDFRIKLVEGNEKRAGTELTQEIIKKQKVEDEKKKQLKNAADETSKNMLSSQYCSFQYPVGIAENMLVEVGKFTFPIDFVILEMKEDSKVPLILGRPFLHTADAVIQVKQKQLNLGIRTERMIFNIDSTMKHSYLNDDTCFSINVIDEILEDFDALFHRRNLPRKKLFSEFDEFIAMTVDTNSDSESDTE
nr:putative ribonuclease H-like domain-containing protein [Tanacetum cinerariifolium]